MRKKSIVAFIVATLLTVTLSLGIVAETANNSGREVSVTFNGEALLFPDTQPFVMDGVAMMPASAFEQLGFEVRSGESFFYAEVTSDSEVLSYGRGERFHIALLTIDYVRIVLNCRSKTAHVDYHAHLTLCGAIALHGSAEHWSEWSSINFAGYSILLDAAIKIVENTQELVIGEDGFIRLPRRNSEMMLPIRSVVEPAGFKFDFDEETQTAILTRSDNPEFDEDNQMTSLFELANSPALPSQLNLYWNPELRRLEARR
ncbi:MAG: hypothetical protein FWE44_06575 [Defluviitaleaceae bacterium]|nr:hypothetical protein [Defluviitaleaceae bacterium]